MTENSDIHDSQDSPDNQPDPGLQRLAFEVVERTVRSMPASLRSLAREVPVIYQDYAADDVLSQGFEPDILGLFVGEPRGCAASSDNPVPACILLYLGSLWDYAEGEQAAFRREVRITYLHELGHYLGWDEEDVARHGLQ